MDNINNLSNVCIFCYKRVLESVNLRHNNGSQNFKNFCKFLRRVCKNQFNVPCSSSQLLAICPNCVIILETFNNLYHQVQCLQLQMEWQLNKLKNVMKLANKVPSRVKEFRDRYSIPSETQRNGGCVDRENYKRLMVTRNVIQLQIKKYLSHVFPQVNLEPVPTPKHCDLSNEVKLEPSSEEPCLPLGPLLGWLTTVIAVTMLCFPIVVYLQQQRPLIEQDSDPDYSPSSSSTEDFSDGEPNIKRKTRKSVSTHISCLKRLDLDQGFWSLDKCREMYKNTNGQICLNSKSVSTLQLTTADILLKEAEYHLDNVPNRMCPVCSLSFPETSQVLLVHLVNEHDISRLKDPENVFNCDEANCHAYFLTLKQRIRHSKVAHKIIMLNDKLVNRFLHTCDICSLIFPNRSKLIAHNRRKHKRKCLNSNPNLASVVIIDGLTIHDIFNTSEKFSCKMEPSCKQKFFMEKDRDNHSKLHDKFKCKFCPVVMKFAPDLAVHEVMFHVKNTERLLCHKVKCNRCDFSSNTQQRYVAHHIKQHLKLTPDKVTISCPLCQETFQEKMFRTGHLKQVLYTHFVTHHDKSGIQDSAELFQCGHCPAYFLTPNQLQSHNQRQHPDQFILTLTCSDCTVQYQERSLLLNHRRRVHHNDDESGYEFVCQVTNCIKRFEFECNLERHTGWHFSMNPNSRT